MDRYRGFGFALAAYYDIFFTDDEETGEGDSPRIARQRIVKIEGFAERVVPAMSDQTFKSHFRLTRGTFTALLEDLKPLLVNEDTSGCFCFKMLRPI